MRSPGLRSACYTWLLVIAALVGLDRHAAAGFPQPTGYVNDFAHVLTADQQAYLEDYLRLLEHDTSAEVVVVTVDALDGMSVEEYANRLFADWGVGKREPDNGILLLVAPRERRVRIEVGYGLEPILPDGLAGEIIRTEILPEFKAGNVPRGIGRGLNRLNQIVRRQPAPAPVSSAVSAAPRSAPPLVIVVPFLGLFVALGALMGGAGLRTRTAAPCMGGALFAAVPLVMATAFGSAAMLLALVPLGLIGALIGYRKGASPFWMRTLRTGSPDGSPVTDTDTWIAGGSTGGSDSGSSDGGSSSSSSSSDFGGGSSGGGGASGSW